MFAARCCALDFQNKLFVWLRVGAVMDSSWRLLKLSPLLIATFAYIIRLANSYKSLPQQVAVHFGVQGKPDGWMAPRSWAFVSVIALCVQIFLLYFVVSQMDRCGAIKEERVVSAIVCFVFGMVFSAFDQAVRVNTGKISSISTLQMMLWGGIILVICALLDLAKGF